MAAGDAGMGDPEIMAMKVWKKSRRIGLVSLPNIGLLKAPYESYASRQDLREHVDKLKASFLRTQNTNRKGITFCVIDPELFGDWSARSEEQKAEALLPGSPFSQGFAVAVLGVAPPATILASPARSLRMPTLNIPSTARVSRATLSQAPTKT